MCMLQRNIRIPKTSRRVCEILMAETIIFFSRILAIVLHATWVYEIDSRGVWYLKQRYADIFMTMSIIWMSRKKKRKRRKIEGKKGKRNIHTTTSWYKCCRGISGIMQLHQPICNNKGSRKWNNMYGLDKIPAYTSTHRTHTEPQQ